MIELFDILIWAFGLVGAVSAIVLSVKISKVDYKYSKDITFLIFLAILFLISAATSLSFELKKIKTENGPAYTNCVEIPGDAERLICVKK